MQNGFIRVAYVSTCDLAKYELPTLEDFKDKRSVDEILGAESPGHVPSKSLDANRKVAEAAVLREGAEDYLTTAPLVWVFTDRSIFPNGRQNHAFVWVHPNGVEAIAVPMIYGSRDLKSLEDRRKAVAISRPSIFQKTQKP